jgi:biotin carboxylase
LDDALSFFRGMKLSRINAHKMVIKPIDANSSRGVYTIDTEEELRLVFDSSIGYSHHRHAVICEQYISGSEFSVDGIKLPGGHVCLAISEKQQFEYNRNLDNYLFFSYDNPRYDYGRLREINNQFVDMSGLPFGFTHAEYRYENGGFYLLEIGARGGGNLISSHIVPAMTGIDNYGILIDMFVGNEVTDKVDQEQLRTDKVAVLKFFDTSKEGGIVRTVKGSDFLDLSPEVLYWQLNFKIGDRIQRPTDGGNRIGFYVACTKNQEAMENLQKEIDEKFVIEYE